MIENILNTIGPETEACFYRTSAGAETDLVLVTPSRGTIAIEIKRSLSPQLAKGFRIGIEDTSADHAFILYPGKDRYPVNETIEVIGLEELLQFFKGR